MSKFWRINMNRILQHQSLYQQIHASAQNTKHSFLYASIRHLQKNEILERMSRCQTFFKSNIYDFAFGLKICNPPITAFFFKQLPWTIWKLMNCAISKHELLISRAIRTAINYKTTKYDIKIKYIILKTPFFVSLIEQYHGNSKSRLVKEVMHQVKWKKCVENIQSVRMSMNKI